MANYRVLLKAKSRNPRPVPGDHNHFQMDFTLQGQCDAEKEVRRLLPWRRVLPDYDNEFAVYPLVIGDKVQVVVEFEDLSTTENLIPSYDPAASTMPSESPFKNYFSVSTRATQGALAGQNNSPFTNENRLRSGTFSLFEKLPGSEKTALYYQVKWDFGSGLQRKLIVEREGNYSLSIDLFANVANVSGVKRYLVDPELVVRDG